MLCICKHDLKCVFLKRIKARWNTPISVCVVLIVYLWNTYAVGSRHYSKSTLIKMGAFDILNMAAIF